MPLVKAQCSASTSLKRACASLDPAESQGSLQELPDIPRLDGEIILDVFTHHSLRKTPNASTSAQGASHAYEDERLIELGRHVLSAAAAQVLFAVKPFLSAEDMVVSQTVSRACGCRTQHWCRSSEMKYFRVPTLRC